MTTLTDLDPWQPGKMDLHHINTGRGNCTYCILPDGTTLLIDAGEFDDPGSMVRIQRRTNVVPDDSKAPWEWIVRYITDVTQHREPEFDHVWLTHFHSDHLGAILDSSPVSANGPYRLSGLTGVCDRIPFARLIDRGWPDYDYPLSSSDSGLSDLTHGREGFANTKMTEDNYKAFLEHYRNGRGIAIERFTPGVTDQLALVRDPAAYPDFTFRNVVCNGRVWTGEGESTRDLVPPIQEIDPARLPNENVCSCGAVIQLGAFRYFSGGDITGIVELGKPTWFDIESPVAEVVGPVDVAVLNHHGHRDTHNEHYVSTMCPRVWIGHSWSADHPGQGVFTRLTSTYLYPGDRDLFATNMMDANRAVIGSRLDESYKSAQGHIVVRVEAGGERYQAIVLDESSLRVKETFHYETQDKS